MPPGTPKVLAVDVYLALVAWVSALSPPIAAKSKDAGYVLKVIPESGTAEIRNAYIVDFDMYHLNRNLCSAHGAPRQGQPKGAPPTLSFLSCELLLGLRCVLGRRTSLISDLLEEGDLVNGINGLEIADVACATTSMQIRCVSEYIFICVCRN